MKLDGYAKVSVTLLAIILIFEIISIILNQNDLLEVLEAIFLLIITFDLGVFVGYRIIR